MTFSHSREHFRRKYNKTDNNTSFLLLNSLLCTRYLRYSHLDFLFPQGASHLDLFQYNIRTR